KYDDDNIFGNITAELALFSGLKLKGAVGGTLTSNHMFEHRKQVNFYPKGTYGADRNANDRYAKNLFLNTQLMLDYARSFGLHQVNALVGFSNESYTGKTAELMKKYVDNDLGIPVTGTIVD